MKKDFWNNQVFINMLITPIVSITCGVYFISVSILELNVLYIFVSIAVLYSVYKFFIFLKNKSENLSKIALLSSEWFILDLLNVFSNDAYTYLKPSVLETSIKLGSAYIL